MSDTAVLDRPAVEDTLFGEPKVVEPEGEFSPDGCFCICGCKTKDSKLDSSYTVAADISVA